VNELIDYKKRNDVHNEPTQCKRITTQVA